MATIKSYTDLEQSKALSKILPIESADMFYPTNSDWEGKIIGLLDVPLYIGSDGFVDTEMGEIHAWSLAALLDVIPKHIKDYNVLRIDISENDTSIWYIEIGYGVNNNNNLPNITMEYAVDACVEMILKLKENELI